MLDRRIFVRSSASPEIFVDPPDDRQRTSGCLSEPPARAPLYSTYYYILERSAARLQYYSTYTCNDSITLV